MSSYFWPQCRQWHTNAYAPTSASVSDGVWSAARCRPVCLPDFSRTYSMCHRVHLSPRCSADFHLFDLQCHNIWTPGLANNLSWNIFTSVMTPDLQACTLAHPHIHTPRHAHLSYKFQAHSFDKARYVYRGWICQPIPLFHIQQSF